MISLLKPFSFIIVTMGLYSCASSGTLNGGPRDTAPPELIPEASSPQKQTHFSKSDIVFEFNEFIEIRDAVKQVVVSPSLTYLPRIRARARKVIFSFNEKEILKENTTYTINFGESIQDFNERNKLKNFKHVFSTGSFIDSLVLRGKVTEYGTGKGLENITVMLYEGSNDSSIVKERPYYFSKTDKDGTYAIENIKSDTFKVVAVKDENNNYMWNEATEAIGFINEAAQWDTSTVIARDLVLFPTTKQIAVLGHNAKTYGKIKIKLSNATEEMPSISSVNGENIKLFPTLKNDSLFVWYNTYLDSFTCIVLGDTLDIKAPSKSTPSDTLILKSISPGLLNPYDSALISISSPVDSFKDCMVCQDTSGNLINCSAHLVNSNTIALKGDFTAYSLVSVLFPKSCVSDIFNLENDSIAFIYKILRDDQMGSIKLTMTGLDSLSHYILNLKLGEKIVRQFFIKYSDLYTVEINHLLPETYTLEYIIDENKNGKWDGGSYWQKLQPEFKKSRQLDKLRENWTLETEIKLE